MDASDSREHKLDAWLALTHGLPQGEGPLELPMLTGSMLPAIPLQATLLIMPGDGANCRPGDVAVFQEEDRLVAHRVLLHLRLPGWGLVFQKGDNNRGGRWLRTRRIRGLVTGVTPPGDATPQHPADKTLARLSLIQHLKNLIRGRLT